jgi:large subunit ribosomal protein L10
LDRRTKEQIVSELQGKLKEAKLGVLTSFSGMNVTKMEALRTALRKSNAELKVVKNTLLGLLQKKPISAFSRIISSGLLQLYLAIKIP